MIKNTTNPPIIASQPSSPDRFRRLKWDELVKRGDFVEDGQAGFEPWDGPTGFRADAFIKTIYRKFNQRVSALKTPK